MLRPITMTLVPSVTMFTVAALVFTAVAQRNQARPTATLSPSTTTPSAPAPQLAARSGYIVASS